MNTTQTFDNNDPWYHAWYSVHDDAQSGHVIYTNDNGTKIKITACFKSMQGGHNNYMLRDKVYVGVIDNRNHMKSSQTNNRLSGTMRLEQATSETKINNDDLSCIFFLSHMIFIIVLIIVMVIYGDSTGSNYVDLTDDDPFSMNIYT